jgi:membrane associated rhomboid family serine protease
MRSTAQGEIVTVAFLIFVATIVVSLAGLYVAPKIVAASVFRPYWFKRGQQRAALVTSGFVHADLAHLIFNMMTYYFFAFQLEHRIGQASFGVLYFLGLVVSEAGSYFKHRNDPEYGTLGASGAISAVLFASIVYFPAQRLIIFPIPVPIPAPLFAVLYLGYTWYSARQARGRINHDAHLGGALLGLAFVLLTDPAAFSGFARAVFG